jgi:N-acetylmuramoyl-L-alanine amidase
MFSNQHWTTGRRARHRRAMSLLALLGMIATPPAALAGRPTVDPAFDRPRGELQLSVQFRARPPGKRYSVTVPIGKPKPSVALPRIEGPADTRLPLVVIDAGHGGHDPGAISPHSGARDREGDIFLARAIRNDLVASGRVRVALTRADDRFLVLEERYGIARRLKADLFISVHADGAENEQASGASIYTLSEVASDREAARLAARENKANIINGVDLGAHSGDVSSILLDLTQRETMNVSSDFARLLQREASDEIKFRTTAHRFASLIVLKAPDVPSILFETGFISNKDDAAFLASSAGQKKIARGVRDAVQIHFARRIAAR